MPDCLWYSVGSAAYYKQLPYRKGININYLLIWPGSGRFLGGGGGNPLQLSWLGNYMDRGIWQATVFGVA